MDYEELRLELESLCEYAVTEALIKLGVFDKKADELIGDKSTQIRISTSATLIEMRKKYGK